MNAVRCPRCGSANQAEACACINRRAAPNGPRDTLRRPYCSAPFRPRVSFCAACGNSVSAGSVGLTRAVGVRMPDGRRQKHRLAQPVKRVGRGMRRNWGLRTNTAQTIC